MTTETEVESSESFERWMQNRVVIQNPKNSRVKEVHNPPENFTTPVRYITKYDYLPTRNYTPLPKQMGRSILDRILEFNARSKYKAKNSKRSHRKYRY